VRLATGSPLARALVIETLARDATVVPDLLRVIADAEWQVRSAAARALGEIDPATLAAAEALPAASQALVTALIGDDVLWVRSAARTALSRLADGAPALALLVDVVTAEPSARGWLSRLLSARHRKTTMVRAARLRAVRGIATLREPVADIVDALATAACDPDWTIRAAAAAGLGRDHPRAQETLRRLLTDPDPTVRVAAIEGLPADPAHLGTALSDPDAGVRLAAIERLDTGLPDAVLLDSDTLNAVGRLLRDESWRVRVAAMAVLGQAGAAARSWLPRVLGQLEASHWGVRQAAVEAMIALGRAGVSVEPHLLALLASRRAEQQEIALDLIGELSTGGPSVREALLTSTLHGRSPQARESAAWLLARGGDDEALRALKASVGSPDSRLRRRALRGLRAFHSEGRVPEFAALLTTSMRDPDHRQRLEAARSATLVTATSTVLPDLLRRRAEGEATVQTIARRSLERLVFPPTLQTALATYTITGGTDPAATVRALLEMSPPEIIAAFAHTCDCRARWYRSLRSRSPVAARPPADAWELARVAARCAAEHRRRDPSVPSPALHREWGWQIAWLVRALQSGA